MKGAAPLPLVLVIALSGCFFAHCPASSAAEWSEPGLYDFLLNHPESEVVENRPPPGIDWDAPPSWGRFSLQEVEWFPDLTTDRRLGHGVVTSAGWAVRPGLQVEVTRVANDNLSVLRGEFDDFLENVTSADTTDRDVLWQQFVSTRKAEFLQIGPKPEHYADRYDMQLPNVTRLGAKFDALLRDPNHELDDRTPSSRHLHGPHWRFRFDVSTLTPSNEGPRGFRPTVGANDRVQVAVPEAMVGNDTATQAWAREGLASMGFTNPKLLGWDYFSSVC